MRRVTVDKQVEKTTDKVQHEQVVAAIAVEERVLEGVKENIASQMEVVANLGFEEASLIERKRILTEEVGEVEKEIKEKSDVLSGIETEITILKSKLKKLISDEIEMQQRFIEKKSELSDQIARSENNVDIAEAEYRDRKAELSGRIKSMEDSIEVKERERDSLNAAIAESKKIREGVIESYTNAERELEKINAYIVERNAELLDITTLKNQTLDEIRSVELLLADVKTEHQNAQKNLDEVTGELDKVQQRLLGLAAKERRINELIPRLKELYKAAGIEINI